MPPLRGWHVIYPSDRDHHRVS